MSALPLEARRAEPILGFWTLRRKMVALLLVASTLPVALTAYLTYRQGRDHVTEVASSHIGAVANAAVHNLDAFNHRYQRLLQSLMNNAAFQAQCPAPTADVADVERILRTLQDHDAGLFGLSMTDPRGFISVSSEQIFVGVATADRAYFRAAIADDVIVTAMLISRSAKAQPTIVFAARFGPEATPCVAIVAVSAAELFDSVRALNASMGGNGHIQVVDDHGIRIAHGSRDDLVFHPTGPLTEPERDEMIREHRFGARTEELLATVVPSPSLWAESRSPRPRPDVWRAYSRATHGDNLVVARRLDTAPWTMFAQLPVRVVDGPLGAMLRSVALVGAVMIALAMLAGLIAARRVLAPVLALTRASRALTAGDVTARARVASEDEIGELARRFNEAADHNAIAAALLEGTVLERTRELTASNAELHRRRDELLAHRTELLAQKEELSQQRDELARKSEDVARADRMKSEFLANMSHELRTPLNSVIGFADLLQVTADDRLRPDERSYLADIVAAGRHLLVIINDILDLAKIEGGHVRLAVEAFDPAELAAGAIALTSPLARARGIDLRLTVTARRHGRGDPDRLRQVLLNLLSNAVKFSPEGAPIDVRVEDDGDQIAFTVVDRGPGISAEVRARLFQPFVQGENPLVKRHQGTGLGLAISKKLIDLHEGTLSAETLTGLGSSFRFAIQAAGRRMHPAAAEELALARAGEHDLFLVDLAGMVTRDAQVPAPALPAPVPEGARAPYVLVVDDNDMNRALARSILERLGHRVVEVGGGLEAIAAAEREPPALILMDLAMPGLDGFETTAALRRHATLGATPIVALSALAMRTDEARARDAGVDAFLAKPVDRVALERVVARYLHGGAAP